MSALFLKAVRRELEVVWAADTRRKVQVLGLWPKNLPPWPGDESDRTPAISNQIDPQGTTNVRNQL